MKLSLVLMTSLAATSLGATVTRVHTHYHTVVNTHTVQVTHYKTITPGEGAEPTTIAAVETTTSTEAAAAAEETTSTSTEATTPEATTPEAATTETTPTTTSTTVAPTTTETTPTTTSTAAPTTTETTPTTTSTEAATTEAPTTEATTTQATTTEPTTTSTSTTSTSSSLSTFAQEILSEHNKKRALHGVPDLTWSSTLEQYAQDYADSYDCNSGTLTHSGGSYGENLALGYETVAAVDAWYNEIQYYNFDDPAFSEQTGHFTQLVWKSSTQLGCASKQCGSYYGQYTTCSYNPAGNVIGYFAENVLPLV